jgi:superfamily II DNA or RNA helicase
MQEAIQQTTTFAEATDPLAAAAYRAETWAGEPFLRDGEDPGQVLAAGTARRRALDDAIAEIEAGKRVPSRQWKVRYGLMLGLERVLAEPEPHTRAGTALRRHQVDALAGMLTELIAATQREEEQNGNGNGHTVAEVEEDDDEDEPVVGDDDEDEPEELTPEQDPGAVRRYRFRHPTASGKTIAAAGFVEAARTLGVLILTHRRLLVSQFERDLKTEGYGDRYSDALEQGMKSSRSNPLTIQTYAWFARHVDSIDREAYQLVICDEAHTALGEKTSAAIRSFPEPIYIGMTATEQLIAKQVSDVFPASVDDLPLQDAARRGLIAPLRDLRVPPVAAINSVPIVGGDFDQEILAKTLDHQALNQAAASLYRDRFDNTPGIVYAAGVDHAYNLAQEFRAAGLKAEAVSGRTPPVRLAETLAAYERGEINVLINAQLLAEGWNSPRATVCMHLAPTASKRVYQQRIGRIMRMHPRKEAGIVVDFVPKGATHNERVVSLHSLLDADFYREGARVTPAPRRRAQRRARRRLTPAPWLVPVTPDVRRRIAVIQREWQRVDPRYLDEDEQRYWATMAGRQIRFDERGSFVQKLTEGRASKAALETFLATAAAENPNRRLRLMALQDRVSMRVDRADFDDLVTLVTQAPTWEKERLAGIRVLLRAIADGKPDAPEQILARWTWKLARATRKVQDRRASTEYPEAKRLLGALANSRGHRHEENAAKLAQTALEQPMQVGAALLASAEGYTPRATKLLDDARERLGPIQEVALALSENLPAPKQPSSSRRRRRRRKKKPGVEGAAPQAEQTATQEEQPATAAKRRRRRRKPSTENREQGAVDKNGDSKGQSPAVIAGGPEARGGEQQHGDAGSELQPAGKANTRPRRERVAPQGGDENGQHDGERGAADVIAPHRVRGESGELEQERDSLE